MTRSEAADLITKFYAARMQGDVDSAMKLFTDDIHYELIGSPDHSSVGVQTNGAAEFRNALSLLVDAFTFTNFEVLHMLVEGDHVAYHCRVNVRNPTNGKRKVTELMDFWTVRDGKIAKWKETCDTAMAQWMLTP